MLQYINVNKIQPHPNNPRKDLGELSELIESIKANGVMQNLTVVPNGEEYTVVIGHRRLAAAKAAGLETVPCIISDMDEKTQLSTMLLENMQRSDLTIYEQAKGFQLLMDFGSSVKEISRKTGFSESTVRKRVKLLALDEEKFRESVERGGTLADYAELYKISNPETRNEILQHVGTENFHWKLRAAIGAEKDKKDFERFEKTLKEFAEEITDINSEASGLEYVAYYSVSSKFEKPEDAGKVKYFYYTRSIYGISLYKEGNEERRKEAEKEQKERAAFEAKMAENRKIFERAYKLRYEFIKDYSPAKAKENRETIVNFIISQCFHGGSFYMNREKFAALAGRSIEEIEATLSEDSSSAISDKLLLSLAYFISYDSQHENTVNYLAGYRYNIKLERIYKFLSALGYKMSQEETALMNGTHPLFVYKREASA